MSFKVRFLKQLVEIAAFEFEMLDIAITTAPDFRIQSPCDHQHRIAKLFCVQTLRGLSPQESIVCINSAVTFNRCRALPISR